MPYFKDRLILLIIVLIFLSLALFLGGQLPYPVGIFILIIFLVARGLYLANRDR